MDLNDLDHRIITRAALIDQVESHALNDPRLWIDAAKVASQSGRTDDAAAILQEAIRRFPEDPWLHHDKARLAELQRDWPEAEQCWRAFAELQPSVWWAPIAVAKALREQNRDSEADAAVRAACDRFPDDAGPHVEYAWIAEKRGDWEQAHERWSATASRFPNDWHGLAGLARALHFTGRPTEARAVLVRALETFPTLMGPLYELASHAEWVREWVAAERWWRICLAFDPDAWTVHAGLSRVLRHQGRPQDAETVLAAKVERFGFEPRFIVECGALLPSWRYWQEVADRWAPERNRFPADWTGYFAEADALRQAGRMEAADDLLATAIATLPALTDLYAELAAAAVARHNWAAAERWWQVLQRLKPSAWEALIGRASMLREQGKTEEAAAILADAMDRFADAADVVAAIAEQVTKLGGGGRHHSRSDRDAGTPG